jgi:predicted small lipoprotein YifL
MSVRTAVACSGCGQRGLYFNPVVKDREVDHGEESEVEKEISEEEKGRAGAQEKGIESGEEVSPEEESQEGCT